MIIRHFITNFMVQLVIIKHIDPRDKNENVVDVNCLIDWMFGSCGFTEHKAGNATYGKVVLIDIQANHF